MELQNLEGKEQSCQALLDHDSFLTLPFGRRRLRYRRRHRRLRYRHRRRRRLRYCHCHCLRYRLLHATLRRVIGLHESPASSSCSMSGVMYWVWFEVEGEVGEVRRHGFYPSFLCSPRLCSCDNCWPLPGCTMHGRNSWARVFDGRCVVLWEGLFLSLPSGLSCWSQLH